MEQGIVTGVISHPNPHLPLWPPPSLHTRHCQLTRQQWQMMSGATSRLRRSQAVPLLLLLQQQQQQQLTLKLCLLHKGDSPQHRRQVGCSQQVRWRWRRRMTGATSLPPVSLHLQQEDKRLPVLFCLLCLTHLRHTIKMTKTTGAISPLLVRPHKLHLPPQQLWRIRRQQEDCSRCSPPPLHPLVEPLLFPLPLQMAWVAPAQVSARQSLPCQGLPSTAHPPLTPPLLASRTPPLLSGLPARSPSLCLGRREATRKLQTASWRRPRSDRQPSVPRAAGALLPRRVPRQQL